MLESMRAMYPGLDAEKFALVPNGYDPSAIVKPAARVEVRPCVGKVDVG